MHNVKIVALARNFIREQVAADGTGADKAGRVIEQLISHLDDIIEPDKPFAEFLSDFVLRNVLRPVLAALVQEAFDEMRARGAV